MTTCFRNRVGSANGALLKESNNAVFPIRKELKNGIPQGLFAKLCANQFVKSTVALGLGIAATPINELVRVCAAVSTLKILSHGYCPVNINYMGLPLVGNSFSIKLSKECLTSLSTRSLCTAVVASPVAEIISVLAILRFSKSKYTPIFLLPQIAHIGYTSLSPLFRDGGTYGQLLRYGGSIPYAIALASAMSTVVLGILSLKSSLSRPKFTIAQNLKIAKELSAEVRTNLHVQGRRYTPKV
jgi:hypothetical protein